MSHTKHLHTCRDCGESFDCTGRLSSDEQCATFDGLCKSCDATVIVFGQTLSYPETAHQVLASGVLPASLLGGGPGTGTIFHSDKIAWVAVTGGTGTDWAVYATDAVGAGSDQLIISHGAKINLREVKAIFGLTDEALAQYRR